MREVGLLDCKVLGRWGPCRLVIRGSGMSMVILRTWQTWDRILVLSGARGWLIWGGQWIGIHGKEGVKTKKKWLSSDRGNRTPGCRVRDGDVSHYTISDSCWKRWLYLPIYSLNDIPRALYNGLDKGLNVWRRIVLYVIVEYCGGNYIAL